jgi:hypothetical protein
LGWWSFGMINSGVILTAFGAWFALDLLAFAGRLCTLGAVCLFVLLIWPRVKPVAWAASQGS